MEVTALIAAQTVPRQGFATPKHATGQAGSLPTDGILCPPAPATASQKDVVLLRKPEHQLAERVDGVVVEREHGGRSRLV